MKRNFAIICMVMVMAIFMGCGSEEVSVPDEDQVQTEESTVPNDVQTEESTVPNDVQTEESTVPNDVQTEESTVPNDVQTEESTVPSDDINPDFKIAMDSYETFFDEYIEFMKKYQDSEDITSMLTDYTDYMNKYVETMEKMDGINYEELSTAEALYYLEVTVRISEKLAELTETIN